MGAEIARALADEGMQLVLAARRAERLEAVAADIRQSGGSALACRADLTIEDDVEALFRAADEAVGPLDLLVNCAGVPQNTAIEDMRLEEWRGVLDANLTSV